MCEAHSTEALIEILKNEFNLKEEHDDFKRAIDLYKRLQAEFHDDITLFNSWLACHYDLRKKRGIKTHLNIDNVLDKYFKKIVNDGLNSVIEFLDLNDVNFIEKELFPESFKIDKDILQAKIDLFNNSSRQQLFRGKFEIKFLISFLNKLQNEICKKEPIIFSRQYKCNLRFECRNAISVLTQYAETPNCLKGYLKQFNQDQTIRKT